MCNNKSNTGSVGQDTVVVSVENFLYEVNEDIWIDMSCLVLSDPLRKIQLQSFSQPTNIAAAFIERLKEGTPENYPKQWSGFAVTIGVIILHRMISQTDKMCFRPSDGRGTECSQLQLAGGCVWPPQEEAAGGCWSGSGWHVQEVTPGQGGGHLTFTYVTTDNPV